MNTSTSDNAIGETAGKVWQFLNQHGPTSSSKLVKELELSRDLVMQGVGWLAREEKIEFRAGKRSKQIALK